MFLQKNSEKILFAILLLILFPYLYLAFFTHPVADDFSFTVTRNHLGLIESLKYEYFHWSGRYCADLMQLVNPIVSNNFFLYKIFSVALIFFSLASIYFFIRTITQKSLSIIYCLNISLFILLMHLFLMPSLAQGIYWYTSSVAYYLGIIVTMIYFSVLLNYINKKFFLHKIFPKTRSLRAGFPLHSPCVKPHARICFQ